MATTQSKSFKGGAVAAGTGLCGTVLPINTDENGQVTNNGNLLTVTGNNAWAEGERTRATAGRAHAEGYMTEASAADAHAEGSNTIASGTQSHAEGAGSVADGKASHAGGISTRMSTDGGMSVGRFNSDNTALFVVGNGTDNNNRNDAFKVDSDGHTHITNEAGNLVKVHGAGIATFTVTQTDVNTYTYPDESDVRTAISNYDTVILRLAKLGGGFANYILDNQSIAPLIGSAYTWIREDGSRMITLTGAGSPLVWTWTIDDTRIVQNIASLDTDIGKIGGSIAPAYSSLTFPIAEGTLCMYARRLYTCSVSGGILNSEEWTAGHWTQTRVSEIIGNVELLLAEL